MALNPSGAISLAGPSTGQSIAIELGQSATATISLNDTNVRTLAQVASGVIVMPTDFWGKSNITGTQKAIFGYGFKPGPNTYFNISNLVSSAGVVASDTPGVGSVRSALGAASYGGDKAIFAFGGIGVPRILASNLVSNTGVVATDTPFAPGVVGKSGLGAASYGGDKAIFAYGLTSSSPTLVYASTSNLVSNTGVIASDTPIVGTTRTSITAASYGGDKAIFAFGIKSPVFYNISNLVSNTGVVATDTPGVGTARSALGAASYGGDKAIFAFGAISPAAGTSISNLVSSAGIIASDTPGVGTVRQALAGTGYGGDKAIFAFGNTFPAVGTSISNLVSSAGVVATDTPGVGTPRYALAAAGYSTSP